jgi:hypothetical protein
MIEKIIKKILFFAWHHTRIWKNLNNFNTRRAFVIMFAFAVEANFFFDNWFKTRKIKIIGSNIFKDGAKIQHIRQKLFCLMRLCHKYSIFACSSNLSSAQTIFYKFFFDAL